MLKLLKELCAVSAVSGFEDELRSVIAEKARAARAGSVYTDNMGNLIVFKKGKKHSSPKLMIAAHMDEVGFMISKIEEDGSLRLKEVGGIDPRVILGRKLLIGEKKVPGVVGLKAYHLVSAAEEKITPSLDKMYLDIGANSKAEAEKLVSLGDYAVFESDFVQFGSGKKTIKAKAIDDRIGCAMMLKLLDKPLPLDTYFVFTVQEEIGLRGAGVAANVLQPDIAFVLETATSADIPTVEDFQKISRSGNGPVIGCMDGSTIYDRGLFEALRDIAEENKIPWQIKSRVAGGTDAASIQRSGKGVRVANISVPVKYLHSASTVANINDIENAYRLTELFMDAIAAGKVK